MRRAIAGALLALILLPGTVQAASFTDGVIAGIRSARHDNLTLDSELLANAASRSTATDHSGAGHVDPQRWAEWGEILGQNFSRPQDIVGAWLASPTHRAVMLGRWDRFGVACRRNGYGLWDCAGVFGRLKARTGGSGTPARHTPGTAPHRDRRVEVRLPGPVLMHDFPPAWTRRMLAV